MKNPLAFLKRSPRAPLVSERLPSASFEQLPPEIAAKLRASAARVRRIVLFRGLCATVAVAIAALLLVMAIDAMVLIFSPLVRWGLWTAAVAATAYTVWMTLVRPLRRPFTPARIAALIEINHPELEERLSTVVELLGTGEADAASARLMSVLTDAAVADIRNVSPRREFSTRTVRPRALAAAAVIAVVLLLLAVFPRATGRLIVRAVVPSAEVDNIYASSLSVTPGDAIVLEGTPLTVQLGVSAGFPSKAYIRTRPEGGSEAEERMTQTSADSRGREARFYNFFYPRVTRSFSYRVVCGSALTRGYSVKAVPVPAYSDLRISYRYPAYTGLPEQPVPTNTTEISAVSGSAVFLSVAPSRPGLSGSLILPGLFSAKKDGTNVSARVVATPAKDGRLAFSFPLVDKMQGQWAVLLVDSYGFSNKLSYASIRTVPDQAPTVAFESPAETSFDLPTFGSLPFTAAVTEDFGFSNAEVQVAVGGFPFSRYAPLHLAPGATRGSWTASGAVELGTIKTRGSDQIRVKLVVADNLPPSLGGPHIAESPVLSVHVVRGATSLAGQRVGEQTKKMDLTLDDVAKRLREAKRNAEAARNDLANADPKDEKRIDRDMKRIDDAKKDLLAAEKDLRDLSDGMKDTGFDPLKKDMDKLLADKVTPAREKAEDSLLSDKSRLPANSDELVKRIDQAVDAAKDARKAADKFAKDLQDLQDLHDLAEREKALSEMAKDGSLDPQDFADKQKDLTDAFNDKFGDKANDPLARDEQRLDKLNKQAGSLADKQDQLQKINSDLASSDSDAKKSASDALKDMTKNMPSDSSDDQRLAQAQSDLAKAADKLGDDAQQMADRFKGQHNGEKADPVTDQMSDASKGAHQASQDAQQAADAAKEGDHQKAGDKMKQAGDKLKDAAQKLDQAGQAMDKMSDEMRGGNTQPFEDARQDMQAAQDAAEQAAKDAQQQQNGQQQQQNGQQQQQQNGQQQQQNGQQQQQNGQGQQNSNMQKAQKNARKAAQNMQDAAKRRADQMEVPLDALDQQDQDQSDDQQSAQDSNSQSSSQSQSKSGSKSSKSDKKKSNAGVPDVFKNLGLTDADWFKIQSKADSGAIDDALDGVPPEYRTLVKAYFTELSKEAK